jgi:hypothetical protein
MPKNISEYVETPKRMSKVERYKWPAPGTPGKFRWISKLDLKVDEVNYQRSRVPGRVQKIQSKWDWCLVGVLSVAERPDGSLFIYDGGHRWEASLSRVDVQKLPCMVFPMRDLSEEAGAFLGINTTPANVPALNQHRAGVTAKDKTALAVQALLAKHGLRAARGGNGKAKDFGSIKTLGTLLRKNALLADAVLGVCATTSATDNTAISGEVLKGLFCLCQTLGEPKVLTVKNRKTLVAAGMKVAIQAVSNQKYVEAHLRGGEATYARGLIELLNKSIRRGKLRWPVTP